LRPYAVEAELVGWRRASGPCHRNALRSPALCLGELAAALTRHAGAEPLRAEDLISSGTLTESKPISAGETWTAAVDGIALPVLTLKISG
jgi:2-oxo-3-hexenedioate decarboxylase